MKIEALKCEMGTLIAELAPIEYTNYWTSRLLPLHVMSI